jgi:hypothetical protein
MLLVATQPTHRLPVLADEAGQVDIGSLRYLARQLVVVLGRWPARKVLQRRAQARMKVPIRLSVEPVQPEGRDHVGQGMFAA